MDQFYSEEENKESLCQRVCRCGRKPKGVRARKRTTEDDFRLHCAQGEVKQMDRMLEKGLVLHVNCSTPGGYCGLHAGASHGHLPVVQFLLERKASVNYTTNDGVSALMLAAAGGHRAVVEALLENDADVSFTIESAKLERRAHDLAEGCGHEEVAQMIRERLPPDAASEAGSRRSRSSRGSGRSGHSKTSRAESKAGSVAESRGSRGASSTTSSARRRNAAAAEPPPASSRGRAVVGGGAESGGGETPPPRGAAESARGTPKAARFRSGSSLASSSGARPAGVPAIPEEEDDKSD